MNDDYVREEGLLLSKTSLREKRAHKTENGIKFLWWDDWATEKEKPVPCSILTIQEIADLYIYVDEHGI